jgi:hypothetical protein
MTGVLFLLNPGYFSIGCEPINDQNDIGAIAQIENLGIFDSTPLKRYV